MPRSYQYRICILAFWLRHVATFCFLLTTTLALQKMALHPALIASAFSFMPLFTLILDLPTGVFADRFSCRTAVINASLCDLLAFISLLLAPQIQFMAIVGFALKGTAVAFDSGAFKLMIVSAANDYYLDSELARRNTVRDMQYCLRFASITGVGFGLYLIKIDPHFPLIFGAFGSLCCLLLIFSSSTSPPLTKRYPSLSQGIKDTRHAVKFVSRGEMLPIFLLTMIEGFRLGSDGPLFTPWAKAALGGEDFLWTLALLSFFIRTPFNWWIHRKKLDPSQHRTWTMFGFILVGASFMLMGLYPNPIMGLVCICLNFGLYSARDYNFENWQLLQLEKAPSHLQATSLSALSVIQSAMAFLGAQWVAWNFFLAKPPQGYLVNGALITSAAVILGVGSLAIRTKKTKLINAR